MITLTVTGMTCAHCVRAVDQAIKALDPAAQVQVDLAKGIVQATTTLSRDAVAAAIRAEGYGVAD
ncbi:heavy-metal-associated domain-containing protein [Humitalea sp. 24SJ18S-53]|uniref:heavy-metal-associated domain-containing protein n=1 Tax=Humitalea sp. 24SJ18S-53 TaxID=3422307 RepID=UPI003D66D651